MDLGGYTATGPREHNEDNFYCRDFSGIAPFVNGVTAFAMVSDGMGGYQGGDVASGLAVACAEGYLDNLLEMVEGQKAVFEADVALREIVENAHASICKEIANRGGASMGATFVGAFVSETHAWIGHVGDSRAYIVRNGTATQVTEDHSQVGRLLKNGVITEQEAQEHPARNRIEKAMGFTDAVPDIDEVDLQPGDVLLLCSDGVSTVLGSTELAACVDAKGDARSLAERVVRRALSAGTDDNSTAVVMCCAGRGRMSRSAAPTQLNMEAVSRDARRASGYARDKRSYETSRTQRKPATRLRLSTAVVIVVLVGLVALVGGLFIGSNRGEHGAVEDADSIQSAQLPQGAGTQSAEPGSVQEEANKEQQSSSVSTVQSRPNYRIARSTELKYVDAKGIAQQFSYDALDVSAPVLRKGRSVRASERENSYGREGKEYLELDESYLEALMNDIEKCRNGAHSFNSKLAEVLGPSGYSAFVRQLSERDEGFVESEVRKLVVDSAALKKRKNVTYDTSTYGQQPSETVENDEGAIQPGASEGTGAAGSSSTPGMLPSGDGSRGDTSQQNADPMKTSPETADA